MGNVEELEDTCYAFARLPPLHGNRLAVTSWAGSTAVMVVDACTKYGMELPHLSGTTVSKVRSVGAPQWLSADNPVDLWGHVGLASFHPSKFKRGIGTILEALMSDSETDATMMVMPDFVRLFPRDYFGDDFDPSGVLREITGRYNERPLLIAFFGPTGEMAERAEAISNIGTFRSPERAVRTVARLWEYQRRNTRGRKGTDQVEMKGVTP